MTACVDELVDELINANFLVALVFAFALSSPEMEKIDRWIDWERYLDGCIDIDLER